MLMTGKQIGITSNANFYPNFIPRFHNTDDDLSFLFKIIVHNGSK